MVMHGVLARAAQVLAVGGLAVASAMAVSATGAGAATRPATALSGPHVFGWDSLTPRQSPPAAAMCGWPARAVIR